MHMAPNTECRAVGQVASWKMECSSGKKHFVDVTVFERIFILHLCIVMTETFKAIDLYDLETLFPLELRELDSSNFLSLRFINPFVSFVLLCSVQKGTFVLPVVQIRTPVVLTTVSGGGFLN